MDYHKNLKAYFKSKLYLFEKLLKEKSNIITDNDIFEYKKIKNIALRKKINIETISTQKGTLILISHKYSQDKQSVKIKYKDKIYKFETNLIGKIQIKNILMAMLAAKKSELKFKEIVNVIKKIKPVNGRLEQIGKNKKIILRYYWIMLIRQMH